MDLWGERNFFGEDSNQPWVRVGKYRIWCRFRFWWKQFVVPDNGGKEPGCDVVKHGTYRTTVVLVGYTIGNPIDGMLVFRFILEQFFLYVNRRLREMWSDV